MELDLLSLYEQMLRSRRFEEAVKDLWEKGKISGEMHLGIGEEAVAVGVIDHLRDGDAMALDHRGTPPMLARGVNLVLLLRELLGKPDGLCGGMGGHMHLFSREHLVASSGIVGSSTPIASGMALASQYLHPGNLAIAFFGEGAINQGMLMESLNLAVNWKLPAIFVCKDNGWSITTTSSSVTAGSIVERVKGFGMSVIEVDGTDVEAVWGAAEQAVNRARNGDGPSFLLAKCLRLEGHLLGDPLLRIRLGEVAWPLFRSLSAKTGASPGARLAGLGMIASMIGRTTIEHNWNRRDPIDRTRRRLSNRKNRLEEIEIKVRAEIQTALDVTLS